MGICVDGGRLCLRGAFAGARAEFLPAGEVPALREVDALLRLDGLDAAAFGGEHDAGAVCRIDEGEPAAVAAQTLF